MSLKLHFTLYLVKNSQDKHFYFFVFSSLVSKLTAYAASLA